MFLATNLSVTIWDDYILSLSAIFSVNSTAHFSCLFSVVILGSLFLYVNVNIQNEEKNFENSW